MQANEVYGLTMAFSKAGLTAGTTSTYTTTTAVDFTVNGKWGTQLGIKTNQATPTTDHSTGAAFVALAANQGTVIVFGVIAAGTIVAAQGTIESLDSAGNFKIAPEFPALKETFCPFGYVVVKNGSTGSAWTFGTNNWDATGITDTYVDVSTLPLRPQES